MVLMMMRYRISHTHSRFLVLPESSFTILLEAQLFLCTSGIVAPTPNSLDDTSPFMKQSELYCYCSVLNLRPPSCSWLFSRPMLELSQAFPFPVHCCLCIRNHHCLKHRNKFMHKIVMRYWIVPFSLQCVLHESFSSLTLLLSRGFMCFSKKTESSLCIWPLGFCFWHNGFPCACFVTDALLHGIAAAFGVSNFLLAFLMMSFYSSSLGPMEWIPLKFQAYSSFGFSMAHSCFSLFWAASPILVQASGHMWSGRDVVWMFVSLLPDHIYPFGGVSFNNVNLVKPIHESDRFLLPSTFQ